MYEKFSKILVIRNDDYTRLFSRYSTTSEQPKVVTLIFSLVNQGILKI